MLEGASASRTAVALARGRLHRRSAFTRLLLLGSLGLACTLGDWIGHVRADGRLLEPPPPPAPDFAFYERRVAPFVEAHCTSCHADGGGRLRLAPAEDETPSGEEAAGLDAEPAAARRLVRRRGDFAALAAYVDSRAPWDSPLILALLEPADGGREHAGGTFFRAEDERHDLFLDFASGATLSNTPPEVWFEEEVLRSEPGQTVAIEGRDSYDRDFADRDALIYFWTLVARPPDSRILLMDRRASRLEVVPDTAGSYVFELRVGDGKVFSAPRALVLEVFDRPSASPVPQAGKSGLETLDAKGLRRARRLYLDLLGRPPLIEEAFADARRPLRDLVPDLLRRAELGRAQVEDVLAALGLTGSWRVAPGDAEDLSRRIVSELLLPHEVEAHFVRDEAFTRRMAEPRAAGATFAALWTDESPEPLLEETEKNAELAAAFETAILGTPCPIAGLAGTPLGYEAVRDAVLAAPSFQQAAGQRQLARWVGEDRAEAARGRARAAASEGRAAWHAWLAEVVGDRARLESTLLRPKGRLRLMRSLMVDLLARRPTDREVQAFLTAGERLGANTALHGILARLLVDGGHADLPLLVDIADARGWIRDRFLRWLGRAPSKDEEDLYGKALLDADGGVELVVLALVTNAEYACR